MSELEELQKMLGDTKALLVTRNSEGGQALVESLQSDISRYTDIIISSYKNVSHIELIATIASLEANTGMLDMFTGLEDKILSLNQSIKEYEQENK